MYDDSKAFVTALGGYRAVAIRIGVAPTTIHTYVASGLIPAKWYFALRELASDLGQPKPQKSLFSFESLPQLVEDADQERAA